MGSLRILGSALLGLLVVQPLLAEKYELSEKHQGGDCFQIHISMQLSGQLKVSKNRQPTELKLVASAEHEFPERVLIVDAAGVIQKVARYYEKATANVGVESEKSQRSFRPDRQLIVAQHYKGDATIYCPLGSLTQEELELTDHLDTLSLPGLLPGRAVSAGETWKVTNEAAQFLCHFDGLTSQDLQCKLEKAEDDIARVSVKGSANGIDLGAVVKLTIDGTFEYDVKSRCIVKLEWKQSDDRGQGPASPATGVQSTTTVTRTPINTPNILSDLALVPVPDGLEPSTSVLQLTYHHNDKTPFDLAYSREWQLVGQTPEHVVFRLLDRGDFVAQVTITPWENAKPGQHLSPKEFGEAIAKTPGWEQGDVVDDGPVAADGTDKNIYRISAPGAMDKMRVVQNFYLIAGPHGEQVVMAFTMTPNQVQKLATRDLILVRGLEFTTASAKEQP